MTVEQIKKELYKQNPTARIMFVQDSVVRYCASVEFEGEKNIVVFEIPTTDMGNTAFQREEPAKLLIRWLCSYHFNNATFKDND